MKIVSIDLETTKNTPVDAQILEFGAVIDDTDHPEIPLEDLPSFRKVIRWPSYNGQAIALDMNANLLKILADHEQAIIRNKEGHPDVCEFNKVAELFHSFLLDNGYKTNEFISNKPIDILVVGKAFDIFDRQFLDPKGSDKPLLPSWRRYIRMQRIAIDPSLLYFNWNEDRLPNTVKCRQRAGENIEDDEYDHDSILDCISMLRLVRPFYNKPLYKLI